MLQRCFQVIALCRCQKTAKAVDCLIPCLSTNTDALENEMMCVKIELKKKKKIVRERKKSAKQKFVLILLALVPNFFLCSFKE